MARHVSRGPGAPNAIESLAGERRHVVTSEPFNCESALEQVKGWITPVPLHFVRSTYPTPSIDPTAWRLRVEGDAVRQPIEWTLEDLLAMPARGQVCWLECAGNARTQFAEVQGRPTDPAQLPWGVGAVGNAEWTGVSLGAVLDLAGIQPNAVDVLIEGLDEGKRSRPMPLDVARRPTTILAYAMNGEDLPPDHGYPLRALIPGWIGAASIKWVGRIAVSSRPVKVPTNTTSYVLEGPDYLKPIALTEQPIRSVVALAWGAELSAGPRMVRGFAWSPHGRVSRVEYSLDRGQSWANATLLDPNIPLAWVRWEFAWRPDPGQHAILTRAVDEHGNRQPDEVTWNRLGYLYNAVVAHPVRVR